MSTSASRMPALFVSHGAPDIAVKPSPAHDFLKRWGRELPRPEAILVVSAHWETAVPEIGMNSQPKTVYDFRGFDPRLYEITYPAPGAVAVAGRAASLLSAAGIDHRTSADNGFDHGVWTPLVLLFPQADIPIAQISIQPGESAAHHIRIGEALRPLRDEGVMIVGSGAMTHNLRQFFSSHADAPADPQVAEFTGWMSERLAAHDTEALADYRSRAPHAHHTHPADEHLLPIFVAYGAAHGDEPVDRAHASIDRGVLAMDCYRFG